MTRFAKFSVTNIYFTFQFAYKRAVIFYGTNGGSSPSIPLKDDIPE